MFIQASEASRLNIDKGVQVSKKRKNYGFPAVMAPGAVADALDVTSSTVNNWRKSGGMRAIVTPGGQHRYFVEEVKAVFYGELQETTTTETEAATEATVTDETNEVEVPEQLS